ncbi:hypothetical protein KQI61_06655 [Anaerocolumna aminovalerica]|uniref:hypothetical protein n=1 Tax=Anaerocolumna aminovalerica TaxID=1527 RepID=UPI001C0EE42F|nr:hypothetical protein [Anaerocolumna aminovalerica]MBU5331873.1 hypothetical protein [Anaerocolumna aminovalerica]
MKVYLEFYNPEKTYYYPNSKIATPEQDFPILLSGMRLVIETDSEGIYFYTAPVSLNMLADRHDVDITGLSDEEALQAIEDKMNEPYPEPEPTSEDRIAAALEYQNLLSM